MIVPTRPSTGALGDPARPAVLTIDDLHVTFRAGRDAVRAVTGVSLRVHAGEHVAIVGESGSGKSATALAVLRLLPRTALVSGVITLDGLDVLALDDQQLRRCRGGVAGMVYQDPFSSLNPVLSVRRQLTEAVRAHDRDADATKVAIELLDVVGIPDARRRIGDYPHQFSGGMRQRVMLAMALAGNPRVLIADEPTTALDVTIQAQILDLLRAITDERRMSLVLITHDLGIVARVADRVYVMYAGRIVEAGPVLDIFERPTHPYTVGLLESVPRVDRPQARLPTIEGQPPDATGNIIGCPFAPRCGRRLEVCATEMPPLAPPVDTAPDRLLACWNPVMATRS